MRKWILWLSLLLTIACTNAVAGGKAVLLEIDGAIGPGVQDYIVRNIESAKDAKADLIIIRLNTPGGLETSMRGINEAIITSPIPVATYVSPSGARAASAGVFIMYASHFAAMAPGTNIGAASPVDLMESAKPDPGKQDTHLKKATNDAAAYLRSLAELRGRNVEWAELAVKNAASISANEAKKLNVINDVAKDLPQLLTYINGKSTLIGNKTAVVDTTNLSIEPRLPDWRSRFLAFLTDPNIAYLLMLAALYGLFFEFSNPGLVLPGVAGTIALLLALYAFQLMPVNYVGLSLILLGVAFMIFEITVSAFGVIGIGGIIAFVIGSIMLYDTHDPNYQITMSLIITMTLVTAAFTLLAATLMISAHRRPVITGNPGLIGQTGTVISCHDHYIMIRVVGEIWKAESHANVSPGQEVKVVKVDGLLLTVKPAHKEH